MSSSDEIQEELLFCEGFNVSISVYILENFGEKSTNISQRNKFKAGLEYPFVFLTNYSNYKLILEPS
jgi:hypothetical protein